MNAQHTGTSSQLTYTSSVLPLSRGPITGISLISGISIVGRGTMAGSENEPFTSKILRSRNTVSPPAKMFSATPMMNSSLLNLMTNT